MQSVSGKRPRQGVLAAVLLMAMVLAGCASDSGIKRKASEMADRLSAVGAHIRPGSRLIVHRRLYVTANPDETVIQKGYPADAFRSDKYTPFCRFEFDLRKLPSEEVDISTIEADTFVITRVTNSQNMSFQPQRVNVAEVSHDGESQGHMQLASSLVISSWATVFNIASEKQPWITRLLCSVMVGDDRYLTLAELDQVLSPSASIEIKQ